MRNLIYKVSKENATVYVNTLAEALTAKKNGSQIEPILADQKRKRHCVSRLSSLDRKPKPSIYIFHNSI